MHSLFCRQAIGLCIVSTLSSFSCSRSTPPGATKLTVAAAANLIGVFDEVGAAFRKQTGMQVVFSYGATAQLAQQIENGAPFDVFAAADTEHVDQLVGKQRIIAGSRAVYARGQLALWIPDGEKLGIRELKDLTRPEIRAIAIAQPSLAPYGEAAMEAMNGSGLMETLKPKLVYATNISMAHQYAATGNVNAVFTAYSLALKERGVVLKVDSALYKPIDQAMGVVATSHQLAQAQQFAAFLLGSEGRSILEKGGYLVP